MNPDLMITIAFILWAELGSGALAVLFVRSAQNERTEEADTKRFDAAGGTAPLRSSSPGRRELQTTPALERWGGLGSRAGVEAKVRAAPRSGAGAGKRWEA
jgi:hypothetical protein